jgi:hypothetical protein
MTATLMLTEDFGAAFASCIAEPTLSRRYHQTASSFGPSRLSGKCD